MTVVAFVDTPTDAKPVITWAGSFAASKNAELIIFYIPSGPDVGESLLDAVDDEQIQDETYAAISNAIEGIVRTRRARKGRLPRHDVSVRQVLDPDPVAGAIARLRVESPDLFIGAAHCSNSQTNGKTIAQKIAARVPCDAIVLFGAGQSPVKTKRIVVATSDGTHDASAVNVAAKSAQSTAESVTIVGVEASVGEKAVEVGERQLRSLLRELELEESSRLRVKTILAEDWGYAITGEATECDLLIVGANMDKKIAYLLEMTPGVLVGSLRRAPRVGFGRYKGHAAWLLPQINPTDYADLFEKLQAGSRWNSDFIVMLSLAAGIATLGLLQSSPAVVIGSMLLAPLMTPMIGMGLALNQGNAKLASASFRAIGKGFLAAFAISAFLGFFTPGLELTPEVFARTEPNILDLLIALFSGAAAAYALARPSLAGTIAGVAIATALVPPLCSVGISFAYGQYPESVGAMFLLLANVLAIILSAAATFRMLGLRTLATTTHRRLWVRYAVAGLCVCAVAVAFPLVTVFFQQVREGKDSPLAFALTNETRNALFEYTEKKPGVEILFAGRAGTDREFDPVDVGIILSSPYPLPRSEADDLIQLVRTTMQNPDLHVKVECVVCGWADDSQGESVEDSTPDFENTQNRQENGWVE